jgi:hypothetical protein
VGLLRRRTGWRPDWSPVTTRDTTRVNGSPILGSFDQLSQGTFNRRSTPSMTFGGTSASHSKGMRIRVRRQIERVSVSPM